MAKIFNVFLHKNYLGTYHSKTFKESCRLAIEENGLDMRLYDKKQNTYDNEPFEQDGEIKEEEQDYEPKY